MRMIQIFPTGAQTESRWGAEVPLWHFGW